MCGYINTLIPGWDPEAIRVSVLPFVSLSLIVKWLKCRISVSHIFNYSQMLLVSFM